MRLHTLIFAGSLTTLFLTSGCRDSKASKEELETALAVQKKSNAELQQQNEELQQQVDEDRKQIARLTEQVKQNVKTAFTLAEDKATIKAYIDFLGLRYDNRELSQKALERVYGLTRQADLVEGYQWYLANYPQSREATKASRRLCEIAYAVAVSSNSYECYKSLLETFPGLPDDIRESTFVHIVHLEEARAEKTLEAKLANKSTKDQEIWTIYRKLWIEEIGRGLYMEAISAKGDRDLTAFEAKYKTLFHAPLFSNTSVQFFVTRDLELQETLKRIESKIDDFKVSLTETLIAQFSSINQAQQLEQEYLRQIQALVARQGKILEEIHTPGWDSSKSPWMNIVYLGDVALRYVSPANRALGAGAFVLKKFR